MIRLRPKHLIPAAMLVVSLGIAAMAGVSFLDQHRPDHLIPSPALTCIQLLSDYNPALNGSPGDTEIFVFEGETPGGTLLVLGGTHATEIAGVMTAVLMVETLQVTAGRVIVIPRANASAATHTRPREGHPSAIEIVTPTGPRRFRYGARYTNPVHQRLDPAVYRHPGSSHAIQGREARNLNRVYPGIREGNLTERVAWGIMELIRREKVDVAFDLHEAPPDRHLVNAIVAPLVSQEIAAQATISLQLDGWNFHLEASNPDFRGLSHREWAAATTTLPFLMESANPMQGRLRGRTSAEAMITGQDSRYEQAARRGWLAMPFDEEGVKLETRVARHLAGIRAIIDLFNSQTGERHIVMGGIPSAGQIVSEGLGRHLNPPPN